MAQVKLFQFLGVQLVRPLGLLVQFALLARILGPEEFSSFAFSYSLAIVLSILSDAGQRQIAFAAMRTAEDDTARHQIIGRARRIKLTGSLVLAAGLLAAAAAGLLPGGTAAAIVLVSVSVPVSDVSAALLRGHATPKPEMLLGAAEQVLLFAVLAAVLALGTPFSAGAALWVLGILGLLRAVLLHRVVQRSFGAPRAAAARLTASNLRHSLETAVSLAAAVAMARLPALLFPAYMTDASYGVFVAFWILFQRFELLLSAIIQAGFKRHSGYVGALVAQPARLAGFAVGLGAALALPAVFLAPWLTGLYLGAEFGEAASYAIMAAGLQVFRFPMFALRSVLQYGNRASAVTAVLLPAVLLCSAVTYVWEPAGWLAAVPYAVALCISSGLLLGLSERDRRHAAAGAAAPEPRRDQ